MVGTQTAGAAPLGQLAWRLLPVFILATLLVDVRAHDLIIMNSQTLIQPGYAGCGTALSGLSGSFSTPGYPNVYRWKPSDHGNKCYVQDSAYHNALNGACGDPYGPDPARMCYGLCIWTITVPDHMQVKMTVVRMEFPQTPDPAISCCRNFIDVRDGISHTAPQLAAICGGGGSITGRDAEPVLSTGNTMLVRLSSTDRTDLEHYFNATFEAVCHKTLTGDSGILQSYDYPTGVVCTTLIEEPRGYTISINFTDFDVGETVNMQCSDYIEIFDGLSDVEGPRIAGPLCGNSLPAKVQSTGNALFVKFYAAPSADQTRLHKGYSATFTRKAPEYKGVTPTATGGTFASPGFPEPYPGKATFKWVLTVDHVPDFDTWCSVIDLTFHNMEIGPDEDPSNSQPQVLDCDSPAMRTVVKVYRGNSESPSDLETSYCSRNVFPHTISPEDDDGEATTLTVVFETKSPLANNVNQFLVNGFNASYTVRESQVCSGIPGATVAILLQRMQSSETFTDKNSTPVHFNSGIPVYNRRYAFAHILRHGKIAFSDIENDPTMLNLASIQPSCGRRRVYSVCVYCTPIKTDPNAPMSIVSYELHELGKTTQPEIISTVNDYIHTFTGTTQFSASSVLVVFWTKVKQDTQSASANGDATFQMALAVSDTETYAVALYQNGYMNWVPQTVPPIDVGFTYVVTEGFEVCNDLAISRTEAALKIDERRGNIGMKGAWVFKLGETTASAAQACNDWYNRNSGTVADLRKGRFTNLPQCPCKVAYDLGGMTKYGIWVYDGPRRRYDGSEKYCYKLSSAVAKNYAHMGKECCYNENPETLRDHGATFLITAPPDAASATAFNRDILSIFKQYVTEDRLAHTACCMLSNSSDHCNKFYELRPIGRCAATPTFRQAWP